ncbi:MAG: hypothetical protein HY897_26105 [Deltaproteobacteria bacterium]|nr:hypothetical protein [Deltaproteobacteria bacterium]
MKQATHAWIAVRAMGLMEEDAAAWERFEKATAAIMHDAVLNVAMYWKRIWKRLDRKRGLT